MFSHIIRDSCRQVYLKILRFYLYTVYKVASPAVENLLFVANQDWNSSVQNMAEILNENKAYCI